jgi:membrane protein DedA with SNARE-associated domain
MAAPDRETAVPSGGSGSSGGVRWVGCALAALGLAALAYAAVWLLRNDALLWLATANTWLADNLIARFGYLGIFGLMFIESSFVPFPSEIVMPPAGDLARRSPEWSLAGVITAGIAGSLAGALVNYYLARYLGRAVLLRLIHRYGRWFRVSIEVYDRSEAFFLRHGAIATFAGRLVPGVRQIISLPAGLARMNLVTFSVLTSLGAGIWVAILAVVGYRFGQDAETLSRVLKEDSGWLVLGAVGLLAVYILWQRFRKPRAASPGGE